MTSSLRRKHPTTARTIPAATRHSVADYSVADYWRATLIMVAVFAAVIGTLAHAAFGQDDPRPSSRRVQPKAVSQAKPAEFQTRGDATPVPAKAVETFVVKSSIVQSSLATNVPVTQGGQFSSTTKRYIASSTNEQPAKQTSSGLKWRKPNRPKFQSQVAPVSHEEVAHPKGRTSPSPWVSATATGSVQQAQASRFTDPDEPSTVPPLDEPDLSQPANGDDEPSTDPPSALDDLLPPVLPDVGPLPDPDAPPVDPVDEPGGGALDGDAEKGPPCKEVYRNTDCCEQSRNCADAWKALQANHVAAFPLSFLDITPRYRPDLRPGQEEARPEDEVRREALAELDPRVWKNRAGQQVAHGRFFDYRWGRIVIQSESGAFTEVPLTELGSDELCYVGAYWGKGVGLPDQCRIEGEYVVRDFTLTTFHWKASALCHKPLYFEEVQLERYGHSHGPLLQPIISTGHFFVNIALVPYKMGINPPTECMYALGYYRPGNCAPYMVPPVPYSIRGGVYQGLAVGGAIAIFP